MVSLRSFGRLGAIFTIVLSGCQAAAPGAAVPSNPSAPDAGVPQELNIGVGGLLPSLDPLATAGSWQGTKFTMFDSITRTDPKGNVIPWLAASWKSVDPTTWEFKLRTDVKFSNGEPMDANAFKFSVDRVKDPAAKSPLAGRIPLVSGTSVIDASTVRFTTSKTDAILPARMAAIFIVPPKAIVELGDQFGLKPVGTGPFKLTKFTADARIEFEPYAESWRKTKLTKLTILSLPETSARVAGLRSGNLQLIQEPPLDQLDSLQKERFSIAATAAGWSNFGDFDTITEDTPLRDKRVRQAINYAVDKETILKQVFLNQGRVNDAQLVGPAGYGYDPTL